MQIKPSDWKKYALPAAALTFFAVNIGLSAFLIAFGQIFPGLVAGLAVYMYCYMRSHSTEKLLKNPETTTYILARHEVIRVLQDTVPNINVEDRWWRLHWKNDLKGEMKFVVNYELPSQEKGMANVKQQVVLDVYLQQLDENARTSVRLIFTASAFRTGTNVLAADHAETANNLISHTIESINYQLRLAEQGKL